MSDVVLLTRNERLRAKVVDALAGRAPRVAETADALVALVREARARVVVIDQTCDDSTDALEDLARLPTRSTLTVLLVVDDPIERLSRGADLIVHADALVEALALVERAPVPQRPIAVERLLSASLLPGSLEEALETVADQLAAGFGVDRCLIMVREDSTGSAASGTRTWSSLTWSYTAERCRAAMLADAPLIAKVPDNTRVPFETYLAVELETSMRSQAFVALVISGHKRFSAETRGALRAAAARLSTELSWRTNHERVSEELDRLTSGPGLDPLLAIWNTDALKQLTAMQAAAAARSETPLSVLVLDIVDLANINHRYGLEIGDRVLRRLADAVRATVREEDVVGRWTGDAVAVVLQGVTGDGLQRVAERLRSALANRPLEMSALTLPIPVTIGMAIGTAKETPVELLTRAGEAAQRAQSDGAPILQAPSSLPPAARLSGEIEIASEPIAQTLGAYRLLHEISRGGMGVVYRAQDRSLERPVAIKMLRPDLAEDPELVERFRSEAAMLAHIQHPNLVQIYSFGHTGDDSYFVMELVEGESLEQAFERHHIENTMFSLSEVAPVIEQIAAALDALHERGIVHRDVKPANVIRDPFRNRSVLVDVGIARRHGQDARSAGTPGFIAPEVLGAGEASPRSDVYGLAATIYAILTLQRPWGDGELVGQLTRQVKNDLRPPSSIRPELAPIDDVLQRALHADPDQRPQTAGELARELISKLPIIMPRGDRRNSGKIPRPRTPNASELFRTRGVVFRSVPRAIGVRQSERLRDLISGQEPQLARTLTEASPLAWLPTELLSKLFEIAPEHVGRDGASVARDVARATVRASFRRFFPASPATLVPARTVSAIRSIWGRYQSWGEIATMPVSAQEVVVKLSGTPRVRSLCAWTMGMLETLVVLSGGRGPMVEHETCECDDAPACQFRLSWEPD